METKASNPLRRSGIGLCPLILPNSFSATSSPAPPFSPIPTVPTFHVATNPLHDGEGGLDHIGAGRCQPQLSRNGEPMHGQRSVTCVLAVGSDDSQAQVVALLPRDVLVNAAPIHAEANAE